jgi:hypothetical protein
MQASPEPSYLLAKRPAGLSLNAPSIRVKLFPIRGTPAYKARPKAIACVIAGRYLRLKDVALHGCEYLFVIGLFS